MSESALDRMEARILSALQDVRADIQRINDRHLDHLTTCAGEIAKNEAMASEISRLREMGERSESRISRLEHSMAILERISWILATTTVGLLANTVWRSIMQGVVP